MGIFKILVQVRGLASVTKNVKGKSSTFWGGLSVSFVGYWLLEKTALLPEGTTEFMENSNLEGWHLFVAWALIVFFILYSRHNDTWFKVHIHCFNNYH